MKAPRNLQPITSNKGSWITLSIAEVGEGEVKFLRNGEWVSRIEPFEDTILTLGKYFETIAEAEKYAETKAFKALMKAAQGIYK